MHILGINAYHAGSSACLIRDGELIAAAEEERFRRQKYWAGFPRDAIRYCLQQGGITAQDLDHIGISRDPSANLGKKLLHAIRRRPSLKLIRERLSNFAEVRGLKETFCDAMGVGRDAIRAEFHNVEHHRAHMASAFLVSPFRDAAIASIDGFGDFVSTMTGVGGDTRIESRSEVNYPHSLGIFFTAVTQWLGFPKFGDEGKIQGLAAYGKPVYLDDLRRVLRLQAGGSFELDLDYFTHWIEGVDWTWADGSPELSTAFSRKFVAEFGPPRTPGSPMEERYVNMAASIQAALEEAEFHVVRHLQRATGKKALCLAGGVTLNSTFNGKVLPETDFEDIFIQPAANDAGTALGVAYYIYHHILGKPRCFVMKSSYTGPRFDTREIESALRQRNLAYETHDDGDMARVAAELIAEGNVLGWFQGAMEWGPRALGNRSILADPRRAEMKDILNARIKHREPFRPFAPSVLDEAVGEYFDQRYPDPFMIKVYNVLPEKRQTIPAVTHVDGTGRLQTVAREANPKYWQLIKEFEDRTGVPVVLNTSFNENEPIVCKPQEAIDCFLRTKMDVLAVGNFLLQKDRARPAGRLAFSGIGVPAAAEAIEASALAARAATDGLISELDPGDIPRAVEMHMTHLTERLFGRPGMGLLMQDYRLLCDGRYGFCLAHRSRPNEPIDGMIVIRVGGENFVQAVWNQNPFSTASLFVWQVLLRPRKLWRLARSAWERKPARDVWLDAGRPEPWCILHALVADPPGRGAGHKLVSAAIDIARSRGFKYIVTTTYEHLSPAVHLYEKSGFVRKRTTREGDRTVYWYGMPLDTSLPKSAAAPTMSRSCVS